MHNIIHKQAKKAVEIDNVKTALSQLSRNYDKECQPISNAFDAQIAQNQSRPIDFSTQMQLQASQAPSQQQPVQQHNQHAAQNAPLVQQAFATQVFIMDIVSNKTMTLCNPVKIQHCEITSDSVIVPSQEVFKQIQKVQKAHSDFKDEVEKQVLTVLSELETTRHERDQFSTKLHDSTIELSRIYEDKQRLNDTISELQDVVQDKEIQYRDSITGHHKLRNDLFDLQDEERSKQQELKQALSVAETRFTQLESQRKEEANNHRKKMNDLQSELISYKEKIESLESECSRQQMKFNDLRINFDKRLTEYTRCERDTVKQLETQINEMQRDNEIHRCKDTHQAEKCLLYAIIGTFLATFVIITVLSKMHLF